MLGMDLTVGQKIQIGVILVLLAIAGIFIFKNTQPKFDSTINSFTNVKKYSSAPGGRVTPATPADPKLEETITTFACADGEFMITEWKNNPDKHPKFEWRASHAPGIVYRYYEDPMSPVAKLKEGFEHALAYATYNQVYNRPLGLLSTLELNADQQAKEKSARELMNAQIELINSGIEAGTYHSELTDKIMKALAAYRAKSGDPQKDSGKSEAARAVLLAAQDFFDRVYQDKDAAIKKYMDAVTAMLAPEQKDKLVEAVKARETPRATATRVARGNASQPANRGTTAPARGGTGGATTAPARGTRGATPRIATQPAGTNPATSRGPEN